MKEHEFLRRMNLARQSRNQTQAPDFYHRFHRFDPDKTNTKNDQWFGS